MSNTTTISPTSPAVDKIANSAESLLVPLADQVRRRLTASRFLEWMKRGQIAPRRHSRKIQRLPLFQRQTISSISF